MTVLMHPHGSLETAFGPCDVVFTKAEIASGEWGEIATRFAAGREVHLRESEVAHYGRNPRTEELWTWPRRTNWLVELIEIQI
jgi:hypothetical protein